MNQGPVSGTDEEETRSIRQDEKEKGLPPGPVIPILCIVDVFLSLHFAPFRGHRFLDLCKRDDREVDSKKDGDGSEECTAFHSVLGDESEGDVDRNGDFPHRLPLLRGLSFPGRAASPLNMKMSGSGSQKSDRRGSNDNMGRADAEGSSPTYINLCTNTVITSANCHECILTVNTEVEGSDRKTTLETRNFAILQNLSWRAAHPSNLHNREMLLTIDRGSVLKVWSARRMELSIPITTATRSISGAGTSCIVSGNFHTHIHPDVSLLFERSVKRLVQDSLDIEQWPTADDHNRIDGPVSVSWMSNLACPSSEEGELRQLNSAHTLHLDATNELDLSASYQGETAASMTSSSSGGSGGKRAESERAFGSTAHGIDRLDRNSNEDNSSAFNSFGASGVWLSVLAPYCLLEDSCNGCKSVDGRNSDVIESVNARRPRARHMSTSNTSTRIEQPKYLQYSFVCLNSHAQSHQMQAIVRGKGPIIPLGSALFFSDTRVERPENVSNCFAAISQSFVLGRFASNGLGYPLSVEIAAVLKDADTDNWKSEVAIDYLGGKEGPAVRNQRTDSCLVKVISCISKHVVTSSHLLAVKALSKNAHPRPSKADIRLPSQDSRSGRGLGFITVPSLAYDLLFIDNGHKSNRNVVADINGNDNAIPDEMKILQRSEERTSLQYVLPFNADSLAGAYQAYLSAFDAHGQVFRVSHRSSSLHSTAFTSFRNIQDQVQVFSQLGLSEQQQIKPGQSEAISYNILPSLVETVGLMDTSTTTYHDSPESGVGGHLSDLECFVIRAIVVPFSAMKGSGKEEREEVDTHIPTDQYAATDSGMQNLREDSQLLLVLQHSMQSGLRIVVWSRSTSKYATEADKEDRDASDLSESLGLNSDPSRSDTPQLKVPVVQDSLCGTHSSTYTAEVSPDPRYGLGLRLDIKDGSIVG